MPANGHGEPCLVCLGLGGLFFLGLVGFFSSSFPAKKDATCTNSTTEITAGESRESVLRPAKSKIMATTLLPPATRM